MGTLTMKQVVCKFEAPATFCTATNSRTDTRKWSRRWPLPFIAVSLYYNYLQYCKYSHS